MGWWELGFMEKEKLRLDMGAKGGATFPSSGHCIISSSFLFYFSIFHTKARRQIRTIPQQEQQLQPHTNTIRIGGNENISFTGVHHGKGRERGKTWGKSHYFSSSLAGNTDWKFHKLGLNTRGNFQYFGADEIGYDRSHCPFPTYFGFAFFFFFFSTSKLLSFWSTLVFLFSNWFILTKSACF